MITIIGGHISYLVVVFVIGIDIPVAVKFIIIIFVINITTTTTAALITTIQMAAPQPIFVINIITITIPSSPPTPLRWQHPSRW